jgi:hypothetical protein
VCFAGFEITATEARIDRDQGEVQVDVELTNTQRHNAQTYAILGVNTAVEAAGARLTVYCTSCATLPPGNRVRDMFTAGIAADFRLEGATLVLGGATEHQAVIPLDGSPATSDHPVTNTVSGVVDDGAGSTFTIGRVEEVPALCSGSAEEIAFAAGPNDRVSVVVTGTARTDSKYGVTLVAGLTPPGGGAPFTSLTYSPAIYPGAPKGGIAWCFDVPAPASGEYRLAVRADGVATETAPVTITL